MRIGGFRWVARVVAAAGAVGLGGCSAVLDLDADFAPDAMVEDAQLDASDGDTLEDVALDAGPSELDHLPPATAHGDTADYGCLGETTAPAAGDASTFSLQVLDFESDDPVSDVCVHVYPDNVVPSEDACADHRTDGDGRVEAEAPEGGWFAYRIFPSVGTLGVVERNLPAPSDGGAVEAVAMHPDTADTIPLLVGREREPGTAHYTGTVFDCEGHPVEGAVVRVVRDGVVLPHEGDADAHYFYYIDGETPLPSAVQAHTNVNGLFLGLNVPVAFEGELVQLVACGKADGETPQVLGCEETRAFGDGYHVSDLHPVRADGPDCPDVCSP